MEREGYQVVNTMRVPAHGWERLVSRRLDWGPELQPRSRESPPPRSLPARHPPSPPRWAQLTYFPRISPPTARTPPTLRGSVGFNPSESSRSSSSILRRCPAVDARPLRGRAGRGAAGRRRSRARSAAEPGAVLSGRAADQHIPQHHLLAALLLNTLFIYLVVALSFLEWCPTRPLTPSN